MKRILILISPLVLYVVLAFLVFFNINSESTDRYLVPAGQFLFLLWFVLLISRLSESFKGKLYTHTGALLMLTPILFGLMGALQWHWNYNAKMDAYRVISSVDYAEDCTLGPHVWDPSQRRLKCTIRNPTKYEFDQITFKIYFLNKMTHPPKTQDEFRKRIFDTREAMYFEKIEPYQAKRIDVLVEVSDEIPRGVSYNFLESYRISEESFRKHKEEIIRSQTVGLQKGYREDGYIFQGGDPSDKNNWVIEAQPETIEK